MTGSGIGAEVGVAAGRGVGVAFTVTVRESSGLVSGCFGVGVGSTTFDGSMGSAPCVWEFSIPKIGACELSCFVLVAWFCVSLSFLVTVFLNIDTAGLKFIPAMICSRVAAILIAAWSDAGIDSGSAVQALSLEVLSGTR